MHHVNVHEVREKLADYLDAALRGEEVLICRRNHPVARLVAVSQRPRNLRPLGKASDAGQPLPDAFWEPLPESMLRALTGESEPADSPQTEHEP